MVDPQEFDIMETEAESREQDGDHEDDCEVTLAEAGKLPYPASCTCGFEAEQNQLLADEIDWRKREDAGLL